MRNNTNERTFSGSSRVPLNYFGLLETKDQYVNYAMPQLLTLPQNQNDPQSSSNFIPTAAVKITRSSLMCDCLKLKTANYF